MSTATISTSGGGTITDNPQTAAYTQTATGQQIRYTTATAAACILTLMSPPSNGAAPTYIRNDSSVVITISGAMLVDGSSALSYALGSNSAVEIISNGSYWVLSSLTKMPNTGACVSADSGKMPIITAGALDSYTKLCLHMDNAFTDISQSAHNYTNSGVTFNSTYYKFGTYSAYFNGSSYVSYGSSSDWAFGTAWTVDMWVKTTMSSSTAQAIGCFTSQSSGMWSIRPVGYTGSAWGITWYDGSWHDVSGGAAVNDGNWHHIAAVLSGGTMYFFTDGALTASTTTSTSFSLSSQNLILGYNTYNGGYFTGYLDEVRVSNTARWTSAFTVPSVPYTGTAPYYVLSSSYSSQNLAGRTATAPTVASETGAGTSPAVSIAGTDSSGQITVTTGTSPAAAATVATITFASTFPNTPYIVLSPANANAAALTGAAQVYATSTTTTATLTAGSTALTASTSYVWNYKIF